jgi:hypothetical protein
MSLGSIKEAYDVFQQHDFSRSFQLRFLDIQVRGDRNNPVGRELIEQNGRYYITTMVVPGRTVQNIDVPYQGFQFKLPGQVAYDSPNPWTLTFRTAGDYLVRNALERLSFETANDETTCGAFNLPCKDTMITVGVLSPKCEIIRAYDLKGFYLQNISEISYNQENMEGTTFTAAFHYQYWRPSTRFRGRDPITAGSDLSNTFDTYSQQIENADQTCGTSVPNAL